MQKAMCAYDAALSVGSVGTDAGQGLRIDNARVHERACVAARVVFAKCTKGLPKVRRQVRTQGGEQNYSEYELARQENKRLNALKLQELGFVAAPIKKQRRRRRRPG